MSTPVAELTEEELARRAGASVGEVRRLSELGILTPGEGSSPFRVGDVARIRLVASCEAAGLSAEGIGKGIAAGQISLAFLDQPFFHSGQLSTISYRRMAEEGGVPLELIQDLHEAMGFPRPDPDQAARGDDLESMKAVQLSLAAGVPPDALVRIMRVYGDSLRRIAEAEAQVYHAQIELPMLRSGMGERQMRELATEFSTHAVPVVDASLLSVYRRHQERAWIADLIEHVETALDEAGLANRRVTKPPAMCFLDLSGYTRLTEERGDEAAAELAANLAQLVQRASLPHGGRPVKWLGDGVMFHFVDPEGAVVSALEMVEQTPAAGLPPAHVGLNAGPVVLQDGDYFGRTVNIAARIAGRALPSQVLVSDEVVALCDAPGVEFRRVGPVELKGVARPVTVHEAVRAG
jgi:adenylate cyclase